MHGLKAWQRPGLLAPGSEFFTGERGKAPAEGGVKARSLPFLLVVQQHSSIHLVTLPLRTHTHTHTRTCKSKERQLRFLWKEKG